MNYIIWIIIGAVVIIMAIIGYIAENKNSYTGVYLNKIFNNR